MHVRRWIHRLIPRWYDPRRSLMVVCGYWMLDVDYMPRDLPDDTEQNTIELPPGHPERLTKSRPLSAAERELWAALDGIDW